MQKPNPWLEELLSISEGTPYHSILTVPKELRTQVPVSESGEVRLLQCGGMSAGLTHSESPSGQNSLPASDDLKVSGITTFQLKRGILTFQFFINNSCSYTDKFEAFAGSGKSKAMESKITLQVSGLDFNYPIKINFHSWEQFLLKGNILTTSFGKNDEPLDEVTVLLQGLPEGWWANGRWRYYQGVIHDNEVTPTENSSKISISSHRLGWRKLSALDFKVDGWSVSLREIPHEKSSDPSVAHSCNITKINKTSLTGEAVREFVKDNLFPFFSLLFGQSIFPQQIEGRKGGHLIFVETFRTPKIFPVTKRGNWFLRCAIHGHIFDIEPQFQSFYKLPPDLKKQWQKVIYYYIYSEEIAGTLHEYTAAVSVSFSALEGLTRSIISTYSDGDQWLKKDLRLKQGKSILDAIEMVAIREFGKHSEVFRMASQQIREVRNATVHLDLGNL